MTVKFMYNGLKVDGKLYRGFWSRGGYVINGKVCNETITLYMSDYERIPEETEFDIRNNSDIITDYIEKDRILFMPDHQNYKDALEALKLQEIKGEKRLIAKYEKKIADGTANRHVETYLNDAKERLAKVVA